MTERRQSTLLEDPFPANPEPREGDTHTSPNSRITYVFEKGRWVPLSLVGKTPARLFEV